MNFTLSAGGTPKATRQKIEEQATAIGAATPAAAKSATLVAKGVSKYLGTLADNETVTVSVSFGITHSVKAPQPKAEDKTPATTA